MEHPTVIVIEESQDNLTAEMSEIRSQHGDIMQSFPSQTLTGPHQAMYTISQPGQNLIPNHHRQAVLIQNGQIHDASRQSQILNQSKAIENHTGLIGSNESDIIMRINGQDLAPGQGELIVQDDQQVVYVSMPDHISSQSEGELEIIVTTHHLTAAEDDDGAVYSLQTHENQYQEIGSATSTPVTLPMSVCEYSSADTSGVHGIANHSNTPRLVSLPPLLESSVSTADTIFNSAISSGIIPSASTQVEYSHYSQVPDVRLMSAPLTTFQSSSVTSESPIGVSSFAGCDPVKYVEGDARYPMQTIYVASEADTSNGINAAGNNPLACPVYAVMTPEAQELYEKQETLKSLELVDAQWQSAVKESPQILLETNDSSATESLSSSATESLSSSVMEELSSLATEALSSLANVAASVDQSSYMQRDSKSVNDCKSSEIGGSSDASIKDDDAKGKFPNTGNCDTEDNVGENAGEESYCCSKCGLGFVEIGLLHKHVLSKHEFSYKCGECKKTFTTNTYLKSHMRCHTGEKVHACDDCGEDFTFANTLRRHRLKFHKDTTWKCDDCDREFLSESVFKRHMRDHVVKPKRGRKPKNVASKKGGTKMPASKLKVKMPATNRPQTRSSQKNKEQEKSEKVLRAPLMVCILCQQRFTSKLLLKKHARTHLGQRILRCDKCGKVFQDSIKMKMHKLTHAGQSYPCDICGRIFFYSFTLRTHRKTHTSEYRFKCKECPKRFASVDILKAHRAGHVDGNPFTCSVCAKEFESQYLLKVHQKAHKGDNYYGCMLCGDSFRLSSWLRKHSQRVHSIGNSRKKSKKLLSVRADGTLVIGGDEGDNGNQGEGQGPVMQDVLAEKDADGMLQCKWCNKKLQNKPAFNTHIKTHVGFPFSCDKCDKTFSQDMYLQKHLLRHKDGPLHHCTYCQKGFRSASYLQQHQLIHTGQKLYQCQLCDEEFIFATSLRRHLKIHSGLGPNKSGLVKKRKMASSVPGSRDGGKEAAPPNLNCTLCGLLFTDAKQIEEHVLVHRGEDAVFECSLCHKSFRSHRALWRHRQFHTESGPISCDVCKKTFRTVSYLKSHMNVHSGAKPYKCNYCDEVFTHTSTRRRHQRVHIPEEEMNHMCNVCGKKFYAPSEFHRHMLSHTGEKSFMCDICGKTFASKALLKSHLKRHGGDRQFQCGICSKSFLHQYRLQRHCLTHSEVKAFKCTMCDRRFHMQSYLQTHMRFHTGEKPYRCEICKEEFAHSNTFRRHKRIHQGKTLSCKICGKMCLEEFDLRRHMQSHSDDKPVMCDICGKTFSHQGSCRRHMRRIHADMVVPFPADGDGVNDKEQANQEAPTTTTLTEPGGLEVGVAIPVSMVAEVPLQAVMDPSNLVSMAPLMSATTAALTTLTSVSTVLSQADTVIYPQDTIVISL